MPEIPNNSVQNLFPATSATQVADAPAINTVSMGGSGFSDSMSQNEKDAILRQIHPIFLTTHSEEKAAVLPQSNFDKFLGFMRLCLEGLLKLVDIVVDAAVQISRLFVHVIAILGSLIVVTLMTNTTDKFIDILNSSIFPIFGIETKIQKVGPTTPIIPLPSQTDQTISPTSSSTTPSDTNLKSSTTQNIEDAASQEEINRLKLIEARRAARAAANQQTDTSVTTPE